MQYVDYIKEGDIFLTDGARLPISRSFNAFKARYIDWAVEAAKINAPTDAPEAGT
jgi:hypothetical protein